MHDDAVGDGSWARALDGETAFEVGYRLHRLGLASEGFEVTPGYARAEEQLRRAVRVRLPPKTAWANVAEALSGEAAPEGAESDRGWYRRRFEAGEGKEVVQTVAAVTAFDTRWRPGAPVTFVVSPALRGMPCFARVVRPECGGGAIVAAGPGMPASLGLLGAVALGIEDVVMSALPEDLPAETRHFVVCMVAGSVLLAAGIGPGALDAVLTDTTRVLVPPQHRDGVIEKRIYSLEKRGLLDQPPGEIDRTIHGLARRRADRLHRAWQRGFFVPRGLTVPGLGPDAGTGDGQPFGPSAGGPEIPG